MGSGGKLPTLGLPWPPPGPWWHSVSPCPGLSGSSLAMGLPLASCFLPEQDSLPLHWPHASFWKEGALSLAGISPGFSPPRLQEGDLLDLLPATPEPLNQRLQLGTHGPDSTGRGVALTCKGLLLLLLTMSELPTLEKGLATHSGILAWRIL